MFRRFAHDCFADSQAAGAVPADTITPVIGVARAASVSRVWCAAVSTGMSTKTDAHTFTHALKSAKGVLRGGDPGPE